MIFDDFQNGILNALNGDAYFTQAPAVLIVPEEDPRELSEEGFQNHRKKVQDALNNGGIVAVVSEVDYEAAQSSNAYTVRCTIAWFENRRKNKSSPIRSARNCCAKAHAILQQCTIPISDENGNLVDPFTFLRIATVSFVGEEDGVKVREMVVQSTISIDVVSQSITDENSFALVDEFNNSLASEPTDP